MRTCLLLAISVLSAGACSGQGESPGKRHGEGAFVFNVHAEGFDEVEVRGGSARADVYQAQDGNGVERLTLAVGAQSDSASIGFVLEFPGAEPPDAASFDLAGDYPLSGDDHVVAVFDGVYYVSQTGSLSLRHSDSELSGSFDAEVVSDDGEMLTVRGEFSGPWYISCSIPGNLENGGFVSNDGPSWTVDTYFESDFCKPFER